MSESKTAKYEVGSARFYPELGRWAYPGEPPIELPVEAAERYMHNDPTLLRPARQTTQAKATNVRTSEASNATMIHPELVPEDTTHKPKRKNRARS